MAWNDWKPILDDRKRWMLEASNNIRLHSINYRQPSTLYRCESQSPQAQSSSSEDVYDGDYALGPITS